MAPPQSRNIEQHGHLRMREINISQQSHQNLQHRNYKMDFTADKSKTIKECTNINNMGSPETTKREIKIANRRINHNQIQAANTKFNHLLQNPTANINFEQLINQLKNINNQKPSPRTGIKDQMLLQNKNHETQQNQNTKTSNTNTGSPQATEKDKSHTSESREKQLFKCKFCDKYFNQISSLRHHIISAHHDVKTHQCQICQKEYFNMSSLLRHTQIKHEDTPNPKKTYKMQNKHYECNICKKSFSTICSLKRHLKTIDHSAPPKPKKEGPHVCNICQNEYTQPHSLQRHIKINHNNEETRKTWSHQCTLCRKRFKKQSTLEIHKTKRHQTYLPTTEEDRLKHPANGTECYTCQKVFPTIHHFLKHNQNYHRHQSAFKCIICNQTYKRNACLTTHADTTHWGLPNQTPTLHKRHCFMCRITFDTHQTYRTHLKIKHKNQTDYKCAICQRSFPRNQSLRRHTLKKHNQIGEQFTTTTKLTQQPRTIEKPKIVHKLPNQSQQHPENLPLPGTITTQHRTNQFPVQNTNQLEKLTIKKKSPTRNEHTQPQEIITCPLCPTDPNQDETDTLSQYTPERYLNQYTLTCHMMQEHPDHYADKDLHATINQYSALFADETDNIQPMHFPIPMTIKPTIPTKNTAPYAYACSLCLYATNNIHSLNNHTQDKHHDYYALHRTLTIQHLQSHLYKCSFCDTSFYYLNGLTNHINRHKQHKKTLKLWQYACPESLCTVTTHHISHLIRHIRTNHDKNINQTHLRQTYEKTPILPMYKCTICNTAYKQENELQNHIEQHSHPDQAKTFRENQTALLSTSPYRCNVCCNKPFIDLLSLEQHNNKEEITPGKHVQYHIP